MELTRAYSGVSLRRAYLVLFILSGFSGLIYQSIWTHYLKLFLGHAAYAQTLVLAIFMGGMAVGAWWASRLGVRWSRPLLAYAATEAAVGLLALVFHPVFVSLTDWSYDSVIPALGSPGLVELWKWGLAGLLILPQSILLGATFPFMSSGLLRRVPENPGRMIAGLYFANSLGAAVGVLVAGFVLIRMVGLPGTVMIAGFINLALALVVYVLVRSDRQKPAPAVLAGSATSGGLLAPVRVLMTVSLMTGLASFFYEIGWIRMLSMVLGSSTHAFELMLSAFITGIAIGGFWIRRHVDHFAHPLRALAIIQLAMGVLAIATLIVYGQTFHVMSGIMHALEDTDQGYLLFNILSHGLTLIVMLPATICAGMTLPVITHVLVTRGVGEAAIGRVYAVNTVGAIVGVVLAVQVLMPLLGLKALLVIGGGIDIALGIWLLKTDNGFSRAPWRSAGAFASLAFLLVVAAFVPLDTSKMASGVFRSGNLLTPNEQVLFHHDGKTATVDVVKHSQTLSIRTNGKSDAGLAIADNVAGDDESTMLLLAAIPVMSNPAIRNAAVIGLGSGMSTATLLEYPGIGQIDTIEIEPGMVAGAQYLGNKVKRTFTDPRNTIHIADAKTFFTNQQKSYDLILSEPSNPWVSGVAGLFSVEFYRLVSRHLSDQGLFAQWFHIYEIDMPIVASMANALAEVFPQYRLYSTSNGDLLFLASLHAIPDPDITAVAGTEIARRLAMVGIHHQADVDWTYIGDSGFLQPLFDSYGSPANSDFYPFIDQNAVRTRFLNRNAADLLQLLPLATLHAGKAKRPAGPVNPSHILRVAKDAALAVQLYDYWFALESGSPPPEGDWVIKDVMTVQLLRAPLETQSACQLLSTQAAWFPSLVDFALKTQLYLEPEKMLPIWERLKTNRCMDDWLPAYHLWLDFLIAQSTGNDGQVIDIAIELLSGSEANRNVFSVPSSAGNHLLLHGAMSAYIRQGRFNDALALWERYEKRYDAPLHLRALAAYAFDQAMRQ